MPNFVLGKRPGPAVVSPYHFIKFSFKDGIDPTFSKALSEAVTAKVWEQSTPVPSPISPTSFSNSGKPSVAPTTSKIRSGIVGIERSIEEQHRATDESISVAFKDLTKLMEKAKDMVAISKNISNKIRVVFTFCLIAYLTALTVTLPMSVHYSYNEIRGLYKMWFIHPQEKQGDISEDDTVRFKSYLMSLGIDDPVTRDAFRSDSDYYMGLAQQISDMMVAVLMVRSLFFSCGL